MNLKAAGGTGGLQRLPFSIRILLENVLRNFDGELVTEEHLQSILNWEKTQGQAVIPFMPARILMQDFTGVPAVVDLASLRSEIKRRGAAPSTINPRIPVDVVIDHSVQVDYFGSRRALEKNVELEYRRNGERYRLLKWAQNAFDHFSVLPPGKGICHQVNLEYLARVVTERNGMLLPDSLVGTDSHTPMINGLGVLGWGVGGIEAEAAMLGRPLYFTLPEVVGVKLSGTLPPGVTTTDLVLTLTEYLRRENVVGRFVEFFGDGVTALSIPDRASIANMSPEFGSTVSYFSIDRKTLEYLGNTGRDIHLIDAVERYARENLLWGGDERRMERGEYEEADVSDTQIAYTRTLDLRLEEVEPSLAGPGRPQDRISLSRLKEKAHSLFEEDEGRPFPEESAEAAAEHLEADIRNGSVVIAALTSCTNTSNPDAMLAAGFIAKKAVGLGLRPARWVKTSLAPGSPTVSDYLRDAGLLPYLEALGFHVVGYGCTTCIGNSGDLSPAVTERIRRGDIKTASVLSGNRNFEARIHPDVKLNFLASPPLVVAFALAGRIDIDTEKDPLGVDPNGEAVYLRDLWPSSEDIREAKRGILHPELFKETYDQVYRGDPRWGELAAAESEVYRWQDDSTYIREAPFFIDLPDKPSVSKRIENARALLVLGDSVTTDHISPAGRFSAASPAGEYLRSLGLDTESFNSYGSRRGNHEVMMRGTFANVRLQNRLVSRPGGFTRCFPDNPEEAPEETTIWEASCRYARRGTPLIVLAGKEYGSGSSRDWAAKGPALLGVKAVIAESFERIHRFNLVGMGILPLQFMAGESAETLKLTGRELFTLELPQLPPQPGAVLEVGVKNKAAEGRSPKGRSPKGGAQRSFSVLLRLDSRIESEYWMNGGVLHYVLRERIKNPEKAE